MAMRTTSNAPAVDGKWKQIMKIDLCHWEVAASAFCIICWQWRKILLRDELSSIVGGYIIYTAVYDTDRCDNDWEVCV